MSKIQLRVVFDIDDVGREFYPKVISTYHRIFPDFKCPKSIEEITTFEMSDYFDKRANIYDFIFKDKVKEIYQEASVEPEFKETLDFIRELGHYVILATNNSGLRAHATNIWLGKNEIQFDELIYTPDKWIAYGDIYFDDSTANLEAIRKHHKDNKEYEGLTNTPMLYAYDRPWNKNWHGFRVFNMEQIRNIIEEELF